MSAYVVFTRDRTTDPAELEQYMQQVEATLHGHPVKPLAVYGKHMDLEGPSTEGTVIVEFPSMDAALAWYNSAEYTRVRQHRLAGSQYRAVLVEGV
jgi:uncharacterized protein (DUF1330 family)